MKRQINLFFLMLLPLLLSFAQAAIFESPEIAEGRFNAHGEDYILSVPNEYLDLNISYQGDNHWISGGVEEKKDPSQYYFTAAVWNYNWETLEPFQKRREFDRVFHTDDFTKIVRMKVTGEGTPYATPDKSISKDSNYNRTAYIFTNQFVNHYYRIDWKDEHNQEVVKLFEKNNWSSQIIYDLYWNREYPYILKNSLLNQLGKYQDSRELSYLSGRVSYQNLNPKINETHRNEYKEFYWHINEDDELTDFIICNYYRQDKKYARCDLTIHLPEYELRIEIAFSSHYLDQWQTIKTNSLQLLMPHIRKAEN